MCICLLYTELDYLFTFYRSFVGIDRSSFYCYCIGNTVSVFQFSTFLLVFFSPAHILARFICRRYRFFCFTNAEFKYDRQSNPHLINMSKFSLIRSMVVCVCEFVYLYTSLFSTRFYMVLFVHFSFIFLSFSNFYILASHKQMLCMQSII